MSSGGLFSFRPELGETPEILERRRKVAESLLANAAGQPATTIGGGLAAIGQALGGRLALGRVNRATAAGQAGAAGLFGDLFDGGGGATPGETAALPGTEPVSGGTGAVVAALAGGGDFSSTAAKVIPRLAQDLGITEQQAAGIVGQLGHESEGLKAINERVPVVPGSRGGFGWAQWTGPRRVAFERWAKDNGLSVTSPEANYGFLVHELKNTSEGRVLPQLRKASDAITAGRVFTQGFLRPGKVNQPSRDAWTKRALGTLGGGGGVPAVTAALAGTEPVASADPAVLAAVGAIDPAAKDDLYQPSIPAAVGPGAGLSSPQIVPPDDLGTSDPAYREYVENRPTTTISAPVPGGPPTPAELPGTEPVADVAPPVAPAAAGVAPVARALGYDPLPQTTGYTDPVSRAGSERPIPGQAAVAAALGGGGGADTLAGGAGRGFLGRLFGGRGAATPIASVPPAGGGGVVPPAAATGETAALPGTEPVSGVPAVAGGLSPMAQRAIAVIQNPWSNAGQLAVAKAMLEQEIQQADPKYRAELAKIKYDLDVAQAKDPVDLAKAKADLDLATAKNPIDIARAQEELDQLRNPPPADPFYEEYRKSKIAAGQEPVDQLEWKRSGAVSVNTGENGIKYPDPGADKDYYRNDKGEVRLFQIEGQPEGVMGPRLYTIPGSKTAEAEAAAGSAEVAGAETKGEQADVVLDTIGRLRDDVKKQTWYDPITGFTGARAANIEGTAAYNARELVKTLDASMAFDRLEQMRTQESPTGGALGAITERELDLLKSSIASLDLGQGKEQLFENLAIVEDRYNRIMEKASNYTNADKYGFGVTPVAASGTPIPAAGTSAPVVNPDDPLDILKTLGR